MSGVVSVGLAAIAIGTAVATEFATFAVIVAVGATVGAIGSLTKVKELQIAGAAIGAVGAIGGLASAAGLFGAEGLFGAATEGASAAGSVMEGAQTAANLAPAVADAGNAGLTGVAELATTEAPNIFSQVVGGLNNVETAAAAPTIASATNGVDDLANVTWFSDVEAMSPAEVVASADGQGPTIINDTVPGAPRTPSTSAFDPEANLSGFAQGQGPSGPSLVNAGAQAPPAAGTVPSTEQMISGGFGSNSADITIGKTSDIDPWKGVWDFVKKNQTLVGGVIQAGSSFLSGAFNPLIGAQQKELEARSKANEAAADRYSAETDLLRQKQANMALPMPVATRRITGAPTGLVNQTRVTGVPA